MAFHRAAVLFLSLSSSDRRKVGTMLGGRLIAPYGMTCHLQWQHLHRPEHGLSSEAGGGRARGFRGGLKVDVLLCVDTVRNNP